MARFKSKYYYWEYILFIRRVLIAFFAASINDIERKYIFLGVTILFAIIQHFTSPFVVKQNNGIKMMSLGCLIFVIAADIAHESMIDLIWINVMVSVWYHYIHK